MRDYVLTPNGEPLLDIPGGSALYAAVGLAIWDSQPAPAIVARVGEDYPHRWLEDFERCGLDVRGVRVLPEAVDLRSFTAIVDRYTRVHEDPVAHFARRGLPFPKALLGYHPASRGQIDSRTQMLPISLRQSDIPEVYLGASAAHLCPLDYMTHSLLPALLRQEQIHNITLDPSPGYMNPPNSRSASGLSSTRLPHPCSFCNKSHRSRTSHHARAHGDRRRNQRPSPDHPNRPNSR